MTRHSHPPTARDARRRSAPSTWASAASSAPTRPGTPTGRPTAPSGASPRSPGAGPTLAEALAAQDGLYTLVTRGAEGDDFAVVAVGGAGPRGRRPRRLAGLPGLARRAGA